MLLYKLPNFGNGFIFQLYSYLQVQKLILTKTSITVYITRSGSIIEIELKLTQLKEMDKNPCDPAEGALDKSVVDISTDFWR